MWARLVRFCMRNQIGHEQSNLAIGGPYHQREPVGALSRRDPEQEQGDDCDANEHPPSHDQVSPQAKCRRNRRAGEATLPRECDNLLDRAENPAAVDDGPTTSVDVKTDRLGHRRCSQQKGMDVFF
jgi:hypothetical protein